jgi:hypothetical protein
MSERPSYLEVDTRLARGDQRALDALRGDPEWEAHLAATAPPEEIPAWVQALAAHPPRRAWRPRLWATGALLAAALALLLLPQQPYVGSKGEATALLYVERAGVVTIWDGQRPLHSGDRFRIELAALDAPWFAVLYQEPGEPVVVLATGSGEGLIEGAWTFDAPAAGGQILVVGWPDDPAGLPPSALLQRPPALVLPLR